MLWENKDYGSSSFVSKMVNELSSTYRYNRWNWPEKNDFTILSCPREKKTSFINCLSGKEEIVQNVHINDSIGMIHSWFKVLNWNF